MVSHLDIKVTEVAKNSITATMPVDERTKQPLGLLHGGVSLALAESIASLAGNMCVDTEKEVCVGLEINGNHVKSCTEGTVTAVATPEHLGRSTQVWTIRISQFDQLRCISRMTLSVIPRKKP